MTFCQFYNARYRNKFIIIIIMTQEQCPTPQNSPTYVLMKPPTAAAVPSKPHRTEIRQIVPDKRKVPMDDQHVSDDSHPG